MRIIHHANISLKLTLVDLESSICLLETDNVLTREFYKYNNYLKIFENVRKSNKYFIYSFSYIMTIYLVVI